MNRRIDHLIEQDLARRQDQRVVFARDLLTTLRRRELDEAAARLSVQTGLAQRPSAEGEHLSGVYRQRVTLATVPRDNQDENPASIRMRTPMGADRREGVARP